jgi:hypothetical protein
MNEVNIKLLVRRIYKIKSKKKRIVQKYIKRFKQNTISERIIAQYEQGRWKLK